MASVEEYAQRPRAERLARIARTPAELEDAVRGATAVALGRRPAPTSWAATEGICHLRDNEEWVLERMRLRVGVGPPGVRAPDPLCSVGGREFPPHAARPP